MGAVRRGIHLPLPSYRRTALQ